MHRGYTRESYLEKIERLKRICPSIALTADVIVGFPTETREEFEETLQVMQEVNFDSAFMFKYSVRQGTIASNKHPDDVSEEDKTERIMMIVELQRNISLAGNLKDIGATVDVWSLRRWDTLAICGTLHRLRQRTF